MKKEVLIWSEWNYTVQKVKKIKDDALSTNQWQTTQE